MLSDWVGLQKIFMGILSPLQSGSVIWNLKIQPWKRNIVFQANPSAEHSQLDDVDEAKGVMRTIRCGTRTSDGLLCGTRTFDGLFCGK